MYTHDYLNSRKARKELIAYYENSIPKQCYQKLLNGTVPEKLYKYMEVSKYSIDNICNSEMTATRPTLFNDLYDSSMHFDSVSQMLSELDESMRLYKECGFDNIITDDMKKEQIEFAKQKDKYLLNNLTKDFRITCLTTSCKSITMWSHYAHNNKGICLEYETHTLNNKLASCLYPVTYVDDPFVVSELCRDVDNINFAVLLSIIAKFRDWEYESEWRGIIHYFDSDLDRIQLINMPVKSVILGNKFVEHYFEIKKTNEKIELYNRLFKYIIDNQITLKVVKPQIKSFHLDIEEICTDKLNSFDELYKIK